MEIDAFSSSHSADVKVDIELPKLALIADVDVRVGSAELVLRATPQYRLKVITLRSCFT